MTPIWLKHTPNGFTLSIYCQPGAKQTKVVGVHDDQLKISLQAPAQDNKANALLLNWLAKQLRVPQKQIQLISGNNGRRKRLEIWAPIQLEQIVATLKP